MPSPAPQPPDGKSPDAKEPTVVGIGASAGGLNALKEFFRRVPEHSGVVFVVVVHLSPDHESHLADLLQPHVRMPVQQVVEDTALSPDHVYVIPPGSNLSAIDTHLRLSSLEERRGERAPIDHFFRTLARTHDGHAIGVVLTGTGNDGALGLKAIKEKGGLTVVQDPNEAEYDGMPQSAIATGLIDLVLPLAEIPGQILRFVGTEPRLSVPEDGGDVADVTLPPLMKVFAQVLARTGRDFARYKRSTIVRRIARRMQLHHLEDLDQYVALLRAQPAEVPALADDLLITVTSFFREPEVFQQLATSVIPDLLAGKAAKDDVRIWCVGCATGEEAYSMAMVLLEESSRREGAPRLQVFASDLHEHSLLRAREGFYPGDIAADVGPERLKRFFTKEDGGYRIRKEVREKVVFAPHNLLGDPPFSRIDLISCRNVLIYLQRDAQREVTRLFHYALRPDGLLLLGSSETIDRHDLFLLTDKDACLYRKRDVPGQEGGLPVFARTRTRLPSWLERERPPTPTGYAAIHQRLLERHTAPSLLLNAEDRIVYMSARSGRYLIHPAGEIVASILKLVREELRIELRAALRLARQQNKPVRSKPVLIDQSGEPRLVVMEVQPSPDLHHDGLVLVIFDAVPGPAPSQPEASGGAAGAADAARIACLEGELEVARQHLQTVIEDYETTQEEMITANEELQSTNEELRSTMEELETSKEELQSMNEELHTVNQEHRHKLDELAMLSSDLQNLLGATDIATLFLDRELRIMRFTPKVGDLFNVRGTDRGRPISDITQRLGYGDLRYDAESVLERLVPVERELKAETGHWFLTRLLPYRSLQDQIQGVVITFIDITDRKQIEQDLQQANRRKEDFLAMLAHELRNPLAALSNGLALLGLAGNDARVHEDTRLMMQRQMRQLAQLVDDLLDVSRISHGKLSLHKVRTNMKRIFDQALETARANTAGRRVEVSLPEQPIWLDADPVRLAQALANLITNACKFTDPGGHIVITGEARVGEVLISVTDDGVGIDTDKLAGLFQMFHQLETADRRWHGGLGIGLALVRQLVDLHGGTVTAHSQGPGHGSRFAIRLPLADRSSKPPIDADPIANRLIGQRILIVEDNTDAASSLASLLESTGNQVQAVHAGKEAIDAVGAFHPHVVLLDLGLPDLDGYEVARRIRQTAPGASATLVALTGWGQEADRQRTAAAGFDGHAVKPIEFEALACLVADLRARRQHGDAAR